MRLTLPTDWQARAARIRREGIAVEMPDGSTHTLRRLTTPGRANLKLAKSETARWRPLGLTLAPLRIAQTRVNFCPFATPGCSEACLNMAGKGPLLTSQRARIARSRLLVNDPDNFAAMLVDELTREERTARRSGARLAFRPNVLSDLAWERLAPWLFARFPRVRFYDYTKAPARMTSPRPPNYHLTFSRAETPQNEAHALRVLDAGQNVAVVFDHAAPLPKHWHGFRVIDADKTDLRFKQPAGTVAGLRAKGPARNTTDGFVVYA